jgi:hypothetical protein
MCRVRAAIACCGRAPGRSPPSVGSAASVWLPAGVGRGLGGIRVSVRHGRRSELRSTVLVRAACPGRSTPTQRSPCGSGTNSLTTRCGSTSPTVQVSKFPIRRRAHRDEGSQESVTAIRQDRRPARQAVQRQRRVPGRCAVAAPCASRLSQHLRIPRRVFDDVNARAGAFRRHVRSGRHSCVPEREVAGRFDVRRLAGADVMAPATSCVRRPDVRGRGRSEVGGIGSLATAIRLSTLVVISPSPIRPEGVARVRARMMRAREAQNRPTRAEVRQ